LCGLLIELGFAQQYTVTGHIVDDSDQPVSFANIILLRAQDSTIVTGTTSEDDGSFILEDIDTGSYLLKISFIGYEDQFRTIGLNEDLDLPAILLKESAETLSEVELVYRRPTLRKEVDRLVFNIESTALSEGNIKEALRSTPGVLILDNTISIRSFTPQVYINDRKVHLSPDEILDLFGGTSASNIKNIEVITNPSARYDAESGAVLNIVMSKNLITGYSGSLFSNYTQGVLPRQNYGMTNFFKNEKINLFANYSYNSNKINRPDKEFIDYGSEQWNSNTNRNKWLETHNFNMNFDYLIDEHNTLSLSANTQFLPYFKSVVKNDTDITNSIQDGFFSYNLSRDEKHNLGFDLDYVHTAENMSRLGLNAHYTNYDYGREQEVNTDNFFSDEALDFETAFNSMSNQDTEIFTSQGDYSLPIGDNGKFETGIKYSNVQTQSSIVKNDIIDGLEIPDLNNTDAFDYDEKIYAAYVNYETTWDKWNLSAGIRLEQTDIKGVSTLNNESNTQNYLEWFPTGNIGLQASEKINIYANYKRSIQRPDYSDLNPFKFFLNDNTIVVGNPELQPVFIDHFTIGMAISDHFTIEFYYMESKDNIFELPIQDNLNNTITFTHLNIDKSRDYGFDFLSYFNLSQRWSVSMTTSFYNIQDEANFNGTSVALDKWANYSELINNLSFLKDRSLTANLTLTYISKHIQGLRTVDPMLWSELSVRKTIFKGRGIVSVSASDLFNDQDFFMRTKYLDQNSSIFSNLDNRYIKVGFRYKFGNIKLTTNERTRSQEELDRLKEMDH
jgi:hypothetical protein